MGFDVLGLRGTCTVRDAKVTPALSSANSQELDLIHVNTCFGPPYFTVNFRAVFLALSFDYGYREKGQSRHMNDNDCSASARYLRARCAAVDAALDAGCGLDMFGDRTLKAFNKAYESDDSSGIAHVEQLHNELEIGRSRNRMMLSSARRLEEASAAANQMPVTVPRPPIAPRSEIARLRRRLDTVATPEEDDRAIAIVSARRHHTNASADSGVPCTQPPRLTPRPQGPNGDMTPRVDTLSQPAPWPATVAIRDATSSTVSGKQPRQYQYELQQYQPQPQPQPPTHYQPRAVVAPRSQPPPSPRQGAAPWGTAAVSATVPPAQLPETASNADVEWKISDDMMLQPWGSILRTLQPSAMNNSPRLSVPSKVTAATTATTGSDTDRLLRAPAPGFREAMASPRIH